MTRDTEGAELRFAPTQEMRFAVVLYGGVSLAIYINGVVQELLNLVRATAPDRPSDRSPTDLLVPADELRSTEAVYRRLGQLARWGADPEVGSRPAPDNPVLTRFVVDIVSGTSAGGLNGVFLAKALANEQTLEGLKALWVTEGDIVKLVNDETSYGGLAGVARLPVASLLNSRRLFIRLLEAIDGMGADPTEPSRLVDQLDLWVTATDLRGLELPLDLFDRVVLERRHRHVNHFVYSTPYASGDAGNGRALNAFTSEWHVPLAFAGRCTSSFPAAFDPMMLGDIDDVLDVEAFGAYAGQKSEAASWRSFFSGYGDAFRQASFADGGYLDNKPFTWATDTLARRRADRPVDRRLIYIEPDPGAPRVDPPGRPDILENAIAAAHKLPRAETIREDLQRLGERNRDVTRLENLTRVVDGLEQDAWTEFDLDAWRARAVAADDADHVQYRAYRRLKISTVLDDLAGLIAKVAGLDEDSDYTTAIRCLAEAWYGSHRPTGEAEGPAYDGAFLVKYDLSFRLRRLNFVQGRLDGLLRLDRTSGPLAELPPDPAAERGYRDVLHSVKTSLNDVFVELRAAGRALRRRPDEGPLREAFGHLPLHTDDLRGILDGARTHGEAVDRARDLLRGADAPEAFDTFATVLAQQLEPALTKARLDAVRALSRLSVRGLRQPYDDPAPAAQWLEGVRVARLSLRRLRGVYRRYEVYDTFVLPVSYGSVGETDRVEVIRISPEDATSIVDEALEAERAVEQGVTTSRRKLGGREIGHFGGFFAEAWRRNDILWGRLDAAERIIETTLPPHRTRRAIDEAGTPEERTALAWRDELLDEAKRIIVLEEVAAIPDADAGSGRAKAATLEAIFGPELRAEDWTDPHELLDRLHRNGVDRDLYEPLLLTTLGRSATVAGQVLHSFRRGGLVGGLVRGTALGTGFVAGATRGVLGWPTPLLIWLLGALSVALIAIGATADVPAAARLGWGLAIVAAIAAGAWGVLRALIRKHTAGGVNRWFARLFGRFTILLAGLLVGAALLAIYLVALLDGKWVSGAFRHLPGWS